MTYQISQNINRDKIFIVNRSEIDGRLDPKMALYNKKVRHALYPLVKLKNMLLEKPQYGANEAGIIRENNIQPRYIRITDIDENGLISANELGATIANAEKKYVLNENDIYEKVYYILHVRLHRDAAGARGDIRRHREIGGTCGR